MNKMQIAVLGVSVVAFGGAYFFFNSYAGAARRRRSSSQAPKLDDRQGAGRGAGHPDGHVVSEPRSTWQEWPKDAVSEQMIAKSADPTSCDDVKGAMTRDGVPARRADAPRQAGQGRSAAASCRRSCPSACARSRSRSTTAATTSAGGFILPNDRVDVVRDLPRRGGDQGARRRSHRLADHSGQRPGARHRAERSGRERQEGRRSAATRRSSSIPNRPSSSFSPSTRRRHQPASRAAQPRRQRRRRRNRRRSRRTNNAAALTIVRYGAAQQAAR